MMQYSTCLTRSCPASTVHYVQGSVISPLLFGIFIDDDFDDSIPVELQGRVKMCKQADDCSAASESIPNGELSNMQKVLGRPKFRTGEL